MFIPKLRFLIASTALYCGILQPALADRWVSSSGSIHYTGVTVKLVSTFN